MTNNSPDLFANSKDAEAVATSASRERYMRNGRPKVLARKQPNETVQIALKVTQGDLDKIDAAAGAKRLSRAAYIRVAVFGYMEAGKP